MTDDEYVALKTQMRVLAQKAMLAWLTDLVRLRLATLPPSERLQCLKEIGSKLSTARHDYRTLAIPWLSAEMSDLQAAEFQEAFEDISTLFEKEIAGNERAAPK